MRLDSEQIAWISNILARAGVTTPEAAAALARNVATTMLAFTTELDDSGSDPTFRTKRDRLRKLWRLADEADPEIAVIRGQLRDLPKATLYAIETRAERLWPIIFGGPAPNAAGLGWLCDAPKEKLPEIVRRSIAQGGVRLPGRQRGPDKRSKPRWEPLIFGVARGARIPSETPLIYMETGARVPEPAVVANGRPRDDEALDLIAMLATDWLKATGQSPAPGRSDETPFGALVHHVFGWLKLPDATGALRRYWREYERRKRMPAKTW
jgi:hypothetical protein